MDKKDEIWIKSMNWCSKYWGCHQLPERSFFFCGYQFPICARCTGIIIGYIISIFYSILFKQIKIITGLALIFPMAVDGGIQFFTKYTSNNTKRLITGAFAGFGFIQCIKSIFITIFK